MSDLSHIGVIKQTLARHGFHFSKALGQNFLINPSVCPRMAAAAVEGPNFGVLEIGPGLGVLTKELSAAAKKVVAVELDERLLPVLGETLAQCENVTVLQGDALKIDMAALLKREFSGLSVAVAANLPYYITSPMILSLLESELPIETITVMVQKEAAARLCAEPGQRAAGAVSVAVRYYSQPKILFSVSRGSFLPAPEVDSAVIQLRVHKQPPVVPKSKELFFSVVKAAFSQRRKTAINAISAGLKWDKAELGELFIQSGVPQGARAENISLKEFCAIADRIYDRQADK